MDWNSYGTFKAAILNGNTPEQYAGWLDMSGGVMFDTGYESTSKGEKKSNLFENFQDAMVDGIDFVWLGRGFIRGHFGMTGGGHPALAGLDTIYCAGEIHHGHVVFKSGHFRPKRENAIGFMIDMVEQSCQGLGAPQRDSMVADIARMTMRIYRTETATYDTTLDRINLSLVAPITPVIPATPVVSTTSGRTSSMPITTSGRKVATSSSSVSTVTPIVTPAITILPGGTARRRQWQPDSASLHCHSCTVAFTFTRRRHHCRRCGNVVCDSCSQGRKYVRFPANSRNVDQENTSREALRVCTGCVAIRDI